jgi:hypothetical protein
MSAAWGVVPIKGDATESAGLFIYSDGVVFSECSLEVVQISLAAGLDQKVIHHKGKLDGVGLVLE